MLASPFLLEMQIHLFQLDTFPGAFFAAETSICFGIGQLPMPGKIGIG
jgi:hypothetical protein